MIWFFALFIMTVIDAPGWLFWVWLFMVVINIAARVLLWILED